VSALRRASRALELRRLEIVAATERSLANAEALERERQKLIRRRDELDGAQERLRAELSDYPDEPSPAGPRRRRPEKAQSAGSVWATPRS
jgi:hypothetical protein